MALLETEEIDDITFEDGGATCVLWLVDDFAWNSSDERYSYFVRGHENAVMHDFVHMMFLYDKMLTYWLAVRDGWVLDEEDDATPEKFVIKVVSVFPPNERGVWYLPVLHNACWHRGIGFEHEVSKDEELLAFRVDDEAARSAREARRRHSDHGTDGSDSGLEDRELKAARIIFESDQPPEFWRWCGPYASEKVEGARTGPGLDLETAEVRKIVVTLNPPKVEMLLDDVYEWDDSDVFDPDEVTNWTDELYVRHEVHHMTYMWRRIRAILFMWQWQKVPGLERKDHRGKLIIRVTLTYPPSDWGKWFYDWLRQLLSNYRAGFSLELAATEEAHELRQKAQRQRALRASNG
jgi:hypothetical protein